MKAGDFVKAHCEAWQARYSDLYSPSVFNNTVNTFRRVPELAGLPHDDNPAYKIGRMDILEKPIRLPSPEQFDRLITLVETSGAAQAKDCANLIRFLAFTGTRISEAKQAVWTDADLQDNTLEIHSVKVRSGYDQNVTRKIPLNPTLKQLPEQLKQKQNPKPSDRICKVSECQRSLDRACKLSECKRLMTPPTRTTTPSSLKIRMCIWQLP
jgi:integrase